MGTMHYGNHSFSFDDYLLTHLRAVILGKFNAQESLVFTWSDGEQQHTIWLHPSIPLHFEFDTLVTADLNPKWIEEMMLHAGSAGVLRIPAEPS